MNDSRSRYGRRDPDADLPGADVYPGFAKTRENYYVARGVSIAT